MHHARFALAVIFGGLITLMLGIMARAFAALSLIPLAKKTPDWWGKLIIPICYQGCMGKTYTPPSTIPPPFDGFTLIVSNHPQFIYVPGIIGLVAQLGLSPAIVSKVENLNGLEGVLAGQPLKRVGRGAFISQKGGSTSRSLLIEAMKSCDSMLIFPDKHRPNPERLKDDREKYPDSGLTRLCVPRPGGVYSILKGAIEQGHKVRVINLTWHVTETAMHASWEDVTHQFVTPHADGPILLKEENIRKVLVNLWHAKEAFMEAHP